MPVKIIATGDIHIGKKSSGVPDESEIISTKSTWNRLVDMAVMEKADAIALTGDIVDRDNRFFEAVGPLQAGFEKLKAASIKVFIVAGNHDYDVLNQVADASKYPNIHFLGAGENWEEVTIAANGMAVRFVGWSFTHRYFNTDPLTQLNIAETDAPTIGLLHAEADTAESRYAPVQSDNLRNHPVDAWILGHIHKPQVIREKAPFIAYPGSPHALNAKEQGIHGPLCITVHSKNNMVIEQIPLSPIRFETLTIDVSGADNEEMLRQQVIGHIYKCKEDHKADLENVNFLVLDLILWGEHPDAQNAEAWMAGIIDDFRYEYDEGIRLSVRKVTYNIRPAVEHMETLATESSPAGLMAETILAIEKGKSTALLETLLKKWKTGIDRINNAPTYHRLKMNEKTLEKEDVAVKEVLLKECKQILGALINQKER